jgi:hypothetical protein
MISNQSKKVFNKAKNTNERVLCMQSPAFKSSSGPSNPVNHSPLPDLDDAFNPKFMRLLIKNSPS